MADTHRDRRLSRWDALKLLLAFVLAPIVLPPLIVWERLVWAKNRLTCTLDGHDDEYREPNIIRDGYRMCTRCRKVLEVEEGTAKDWRQA